jgi:hypothetical protein
MAATQEALYREHDLELSWSEASLPERERTKHVHRLHPYLGKFIPQLVETLLERHVPEGGTVLDPFAGSGTTLVQALESGYDATGVDIAGFNSLLMRVKTRPYNLDALREDLLWAYGQADAFEPRGCYPREASAYVRAWYAPVAAEELLHFRSLVEQVGSADVLRVVLARSARSARRTAHFDLDFPKEPRLEPYWCFKHRRECRPVEGARRFLLRYTLDTLERIEAFAALRADGRAAAVLHGDARVIDLGGPFAGVITSPPYPGLIDYHEQHRYAYELLGVDERRDLEAADRRLAEHPCHGRDIRRRLRERRERRSLESAVADEEGEPAAHDPRRFVAGFGAGAPFSVASRSRSSSWLISPAGRSTSKECSPFLALIRRRLPSPRFIQL